MLRRIGTTTAAAVLVAFCTTAVVQANTHKKPPTKETFNLAMNGRIEVPMGSPGGTGTVSLTLDATKGRVCFHFVVHGIGQPTAAHIHVGRAHTAGNVVVPLYGGSGPLRGCVSASRTTIKQIIHRPNNYYVNIHTSRYPNGALRAQL
jgi:hypothetical protein